MSFRSSSRFPSRSSSRPIRLVCRLVVRLVMSSRCFMSSVLPSVGSLVVAVLSCSCVLVPSRFALASRLVLASRLSSRWLISSSPVISFRLACGRLGSVLVPGSRVRAVPSCSPLVPHSLRSSVSVHVLGRGEGLCRYGHGAWVACSSRLIRSLVAGRLCGRMWALGAVSCCSPLITCPLMPHCSPSPTGSLAPMRAHPPHPRSKTTRGRMAKADEDKTGTRKQRDG